MLTATWNKSRLIKMQRKNIKGQEQINQQFNGCKSQDQQPSTIMQGYLHVITGTL